MVQNLSWWQLIQGANVLLVDVNRLPRFDMMVPLLLMIEVSMSCVSEEEMLP